MAAITCFSDAARVGTISMVWPNGRAEFFYPIVSMKRLLLLLAGLVTSFQAATGSPSQLEHGLSRSEVLTIMGPPLDKSERAVKHEDVWEYKNITLVFNDGLLTRWSKDDGEEALQERPSQVAAAPSKHAPQSLTFQDLVKNIPDETSSGGQPPINFPVQVQPMMDSPAGAGMPPPPGQIPGQIPSQIPGMNGTSPGMSGLLEKLRERVGTMPPP